MIALADAADLDGVVPAALCAIAALVHAARWLLWHPWRTTKVPLVWVLHLAYLWVPLHLGLRVLAEMGSAAVHALTVGAVGGLVIGMMVRTAGGHTGRELPLCRAVLAGADAAARRRAPGLMPTMTAVDEPFASAARPSRSAPAGGRPAPPPS